MKLYTLHFQEDDKGKKVVQGYSAKKMSTVEFNARVNKSFAELSLKRIAVRKSKEYNKAILGKEIGIID